MDQRAERRPYINDPFERLNEDGQARVTAHAVAFQGADSASEPERLALRRAMARFLIDTGIASARGYV